jgi:hypothetical protein
MAEAFAELFGIEWTEWVTDLPYHATTVAGTGDKGVR